MLKAISGRTLLFSAYVFKHERFMNAVQTSQDKRYRERFIRKNRLPGISPQSSKSSRECLGNNVLGTQAPSKVSHT